MYNWKTERERGAKEEEMIYNFPELNEKYYIPQKLESIILCNEQPVHVSGLSKTNLVLLFTIPQIGLVKYCSI